MCQDLDLFGEVVVTLDDVEYWLRCVPRLDDDTRQNHVSDYINGWDVINKIKRSKLAGEFYILKPLGNVNNSSLSIKLHFHFKPKYRHVKTARFSDFQRLDKLAFIGKERKKRMPKAPALDDLPNPYNVKVA